MFRPVQISAVLNGWIVTVGCQTVVYQDRAHLVSDLDQYLRDPEGTEARFLKTAVNSGLLGGLGQLNPTAVAPPSYRDEAATQSVASTEHYAARERR